MNFVDYRISDGALRNNMLLKGGRTNGNYSLETTLYKVPGPSRAMVVSVRDKFVRWISSPSRSSLPLGANIARQSGRLSITEENICLTRSNQTYSFEVNQLTSILLANSTGTRQPFASWALGNTSSAHGSLPHRL